MLPELIAPHLTTKRGGAGARFGDYLVMDCPKLSYLSGRRHNHFANTKFPRPNTQISNFPLLNTQMCEFMSKTLKFAPEIRPDREGKHAQ